MTDMFFSLASQDLPLISEPKYLFFKTQVKINEYILILPTLMVVSLNFLNDTQDSLRYCIF